MDYRSLFAPVLDARHPTHVSSETGMLLLGGPRHEGVFLPALLLEGRGEARPVSAGGMRRLGLMLFGLVDGHYDPSQLQSLVVH